MTPIDEKMKRELSPATLAIVGVVVGAIALALVIWGVNRVSSPIVETGSPPPGYFEQYKGKSGGSN